MDTSKFIDFLLPFMNIFIGDSLGNFMLGMFSKEVNKQRIKLIIKKSCDNAYNEMDGLPDDIFDQVYPIIDESIKYNKIIDTDKVLQNLSPEAKTYLFNKIRIDLIDIIDLKQFITEYKLTPEELTHEMYSIKMIVEKLQKEVNDMKMIETGSKICVLFLAANPDGTARLKLDEEVRLISEMIQKSKYGGTLIFESRWAIRTQDILQAINETNPTIVHFSGHGSDKDELIVLNTDGSPKRVSKEAIVQVMMTSSDTIRLVFFNTCFSFGQAQAVVEHVDFSIGMTTTIGDYAARVFAAQFYSSLGFGKSIFTSFEQAKAALMLESIPEENTPALYCKINVDPQMATLIS